MRRVDQDGQGISTFHLAAFGDQAILLDTVGDRYLGLSPRLAAAAHDVAYGHADAESARNILAAQGIGTPQSTVEVCRVREPLRADWPIDLREGQTSPIGVQMAAFWNVARADAWLRRETFDRYLQRLRAAKAKSTHRRPEHSPQDLLNAYVTIRPWYVTKPICRLDAPAICLLFWRYGHPADLVFGVRSTPFAAHCWAQHQSAVLRDTRDRVLQYQPIMVI